MPAAIADVTSRGKRPRTALILCGGGSRAAVEIGLYRAIVELGIHVDFIVASSSGAVNGAFIASGMDPGAIAEQWKTLRTRNVIGTPWPWIRVLRGAPSLYSNSRLRRLLQRRLPVACFEDLRIPLTILATDLESGEAVPLRSGGLIDAILASTALPGVFPPVAWQRRQLVDASLSDNVPIDFAVAEGAERVMGMLCGCRHPFGSRPRWSSILAQSFSLAIQAKFQCDLRVYRSQTEVHILKPCPGPDLGLLEFDRAWTLIEPAYQHALRELQRDLTGISEGRRGNSKEVV